MASLQDMKINHFEHLCFGIMGPFLREWESEAMAGTVFFSLADELKYWSIRDIHW